MALPRRVTPELQEQIQELHADGKNQSEIAEITGIPRSTLQRACLEMGLVFDKSARQERLHRSRVLNEKEKRAELRQGFLDDIAKLRDELFSETSYEAATASGKLIRWKRASPTPRDKFSLTGAIQGLVNSYIRLADKYEDEGLSDAASLLGSVYQMLKININPPPDEP